VRADQLLEDFADKWGPHRAGQYLRFVADLRQLLEEYSKATAPQQPCEKET